MVTGLHAAGLHQHRGFLTLGLFQSSLLNSHHHQMLKLFSKPHTIGIMAAPHLLARNDFHE